MPIKILHSSDVHLESKLNFLGEKAGTHRKQLLDTFESVVNKAISERYDLVVIAGDLFDTPFPSSTVTHKVFELFTKLKDAGVRLALIAGNHDRLETGSIFFDKNFNSLDKNLIHFFNKPEDVIWEIPELDLSVVGVSLQNQKEVASPLEKIKVVPKTKYSVAILHGSVVMGEKNTNNPLDIKDLNKLKYDYIALGDWHSTKQVTNTPETWYSGSPELVNIDQSGAGNVLSVEIGDKTKVEIVKIGKYEVLRTELDITGAVSITDIAKRLSQIGIKQSEVKFVELILTGTRSLTTQFTTEDLYEALRDKFYYLKLKDNSHLKLSEEELGMFPEEFLAGKFIRNLQSKKGEDYSQNQIIDEAIQLGVRLLAEK